MRLLRLIAVGMVGITLLSCSNPLGGSGDDSTSLIISEVGDPIDGGMFVELYNATPVPISLSEWEIRLYINGNPTFGSTVTLPDINLGAGATFVVVNSSSLTQFSTIYPEGIYGAPEMVSPSIAGTGDDVYELFDGNITVDIFGVIGIDGTGKNWEYYSRVVQRIPAVIHGTDNFNISEWSFGDSGTNFPASPGSH